MEKEKFINWYGNAENAVSVVTSSNILAVNLMLDRIIRIMQEECPDVLTKTRTYIAIKDTYTIESIINNIRTCNEDNVNKVVKLVEKLL